MHPTPSAIAPHTISEHGGLRAVLGKCDASVLQWNMALHLCTELHTGGGKGVTTINSPHLSLPGDTHLIILHLLLQGLQVMRGQLLDEQHQLLLACAQQV